MPDTTILKISQIIESYCNNSDTMPIELLLTERDRLASFSYHLAEMCGSAKAEYNSNYFQRKMGVLKTTQKFLNSGLKFNASENQSLLENENLYEEEMLTDAIAYRYDLLLKQSNRVLDAMSQRISYLKVEKEYSVSIQSSLGMKK